MQGVLSILIFESALQFIGAFIGLSIFMISIMGYLEDGKKRTVTEIHRQLGIEQSTASHHLVILKDRGVLASKRDGKNTWYFLKHQNFKAILNSVSECCRD